MFPLVFCSDHAFSGEAAPKSKSGKKVFSDNSKSSYRTAIKFTPSFLLIFLWFFHHLFLFYFFLYFYFFTYRIFFCQKSFFPKMVQNDSRTSITPIEMIFTPKFLTYALCTDDCLYSRRCMGARTLTPSPPAERAQRVRPHLCERIYEGCTTMTVYIAVGAWVLGPYSPQPSERSERGHTNASAHMKAVHQWMG